MRTPWHIWIVGGLSLAWNAFGATDFLLTQANHAGYMAQFTDAQVAYFRGFPAWVNVSWGAAVLLSVLGSVLILLRLGLAAPVLGLAFLAMVLTDLHNFVLAETPIHAVTGPEALWISAAIFIVALLLWLYARAMRRAGVLR